MPKIKSISEKAAGKLISAIQNEWSKEAGLSVSEISENVMYKGHELLQARTANRMLEVLNGNSIEFYLGETWVRAHKSILPALRNLENSIEDEKS